MSRSRDDVGLLMLDLLRLSCSVLGMPRGMVDMYANVLGVHSVVLSHTSSQQSAVTQQLIIPGADG